MRRYKNKREEKIDICFRADELVLRKYGIFPYYEGEDYIDPLDRLLWGYTIPEKVELSDDKARFGEYDMRNIEDIKSAICDLIAAYRQARLSNTLNDPTYKTLEIPDSIKKQMIKDTVRKEGSKQTYQLRDGEVWTDEDFQREVDKINRNYLVYFSDGTMMFEDLSDLTDDQIKEYKAILGSEVPNLAIKDIV